MVFTTTITTTYWTGCFFCQDEDYRNRTFHFLRFLADNNFHFTFIADEGRIEIQFAGFNASSQEAKVDAFIKLHDLEILK